MVPLLLLAALVLRQPGELLKTFFVLEELHDVVLPCVVHVAQLRTALRAPEPVPVHFIVKVFHFLLVFKILLFVLPLPISLSN